MSHAYRPLALSILLGSVIPFVVRAQEAPVKATAILRGSIQDLVETPLEGAEIEILGLGRKTTTAASGAYRFNDIPQGRYWIVVRRIGYEPLRVALTFEPGNDRRIIFQLDRRPQQLADVEVTAAERIWEQRYRGFVHRSRSAWGIFLTRDDLKRQPAARLGDVVRRYFPWVSAQALERSPFILGASSPFAGGYTTGPGRYSCSPLVSLNGAPPHGGWVVNDFQPDDVEAVEVYRRSNDVPMEFVGASRGRSCGLVVIWLR